MSAYKQLKGNLGVLDAMGPAGATLKSQTTAFLEASRFSRTGSTIDGRFTLSNELIEAAIPVAKSEMAGGL